ncbi:hypothetical protein EUGRSUZ_D01186 [Eucalyptus grandis]|uniref:Uncharacterized protein n=2 Tax=Eucalyptus grandis TaxID=71139 RepID=A0ACC3L5F0_EUCGR|nr:hypothetical protein EUGRSUZ_D01186 [Eucalyptus grandis]
MVLLEWLVCRRSLKGTRPGSIAFSFSGNGAVYSSSSQFFLTRYIRREHAHGKCYIQAFFYCFLPRSLPHRMEGTD